jgi:hypothetical protein
LGGDESISLRKAFAIRLLNGFQRSSGPRFRAFKIRDIAISKTSCRVCSQRDPNFAKLKFTNREKYIQRPFRDHHRTTLTNSPFIEGSDILIAVVRDNE